MRLRTGAIFALVLTVLGCVMGSAKPQAVAAQQPVQKSASQSYYKLDVPNGTAAVTVDAEIMNSSNKDLATVVLWAMPGASDPVVKQGDTVLAIETKPLDFDDGSRIVAITATTPKPLKPGQRIELTMTYTLGNQNSEHIDFQPGAIEALFVSQGPGSFVFIDTPATGETYLDPGCLVASKQPSEVKDAGMVRHVCGEATLIALNAEDKGVQSQCAGLDDKCRQRILTSPFTAFAQSVTDPSLIGILETTVALKNGDVPLTLRYFRKDQAWANTQFDIARRALPALEALFGFPYPHESIVMLQSHHIELLGAAGIAFTKTGQVMLAQGTTIDEHVTVHELAHQWAGFLTTDKKSVWEGLAEWAAIDLSGPIGYKPDSFDWKALEPLGVKMNLYGWDEYYPLPSSYWYAKAASFFSAYEAAIGGRENMTRVLGQMYENPPKPRDHRWLMDRGEEVSGANLDALYLEWIFNPDTAPATLAERRAAHDAVKALVARAATYGLTGYPSDIRENLDVWSFRGVAGQVEEANKILDRYGEVLAFMQETGLSTAAMQETWSTKRLSDSRQLAEDIHQTLSAIINAEKALSTSADDAIGREQLAEAKTAFLEGDMSTAKELASGSVTKRYNTDVAGKLIQVAKDRQATFKPSLFTRIGLWGSNPDADLIQAEKAYAEGDVDQAIESARSAYKGYEDATKRGIFRLALAAAAMCGLSAGTWWLLRKIDNGRPDAPGSKAPLEGHILAPREDRASSWKDWTNNP